ncbi:MAG: DUF885 family protein [Hyphomonadaceae bacterium]|nr:DUF885 family protein [Hyphomonadaceae bacterium]
MFRTLTARLGKALSGALVIGALIAATPAHAQNNQGTALDEIIAAYERIDREANPGSAGREGDRAALRRLRDVRPETTQARTAALAALGQRLARIDAAGLPADAALNHALLSRLIATSVEEAQFDFDRIAFQNDSGFHTEIDYYARTTNIATADDAEAWIARLSATPTFYEQNIANLRRGIATRFTQPRIVVDRVLDVARRQAETAPEATSFMMPFASMPTTIPADAQARYRTQALAIVRDRILPAQHAFVTFLEHDYLPAARPRIGWRSVSRGAESYRFLVRRETTTNMTPEQVHQLGLSEVARIRGRMEETMRAAGFSGTFPEFLAFLRSDPRFYATSPQQLLEKAAEIAKRSDDQLPRLFGTLPRLPYGVRAVPAEMAEGYTTGRYWEGSQAQGVAGGYMVNTSHLDQRGLYELPALTVHEAVPGHHLQIALQQELTDLPYFRRNSFFTAYVEGWGLYSEHLGEEMGIYRDPYELFGRLSYEMWRACRLVADTGIHWMGWDIERARRCFAENSALAPHNIQTELERYISWPGQALAYKVGELRIKALRAEAERALGPRFNVRTFHDQILLSGALPLDVLEARTRAWIAAQQAAPRP